MDNPNGLSVPRKMRSLFDEISGATDTFCRRHLNEEYALICRKLAAALCRKRPSPVLRGKPHTWAAGIVHTAGWLNFLSDPTQEPYMSVAELARQFGVSSSTLSAKKKIVQNALRVMPLDPDYTLASLLEENPLTWMMEVDGFIMDARTVPREIQEVAHAQGLIPCVPDDETASANESPEAPTIIQFPGRCAGLSRRRSIASRPGHEPRLFADFED